MSNKTTIFFIFAICLLVNQIVSASGMPSLADCCKKDYVEACNCISAVSKYSQKNF
ncbi:unnamed protein product [Meloidogyne enterolobii]|uniref:Uncharacterized protein n=1 Tax=Meloidogyne enterolobii TaxID=390850 RepID=A0ACB1ALF7_MELEN